MKEDVLPRVAAILKGLPGVVEVAGMDKKQRRRAAELELSHERTMSLPVRNLGVSLMAERDACFVLLKATTFRPPKAPSVYLVEEGGPAGGGPAPAGPEGGGDHVLTVAGKSYRIVGEEVAGGPGKYTEAVIPLDESFVVFPNRRSRPAVSCVFLLPPLPFPELEKVAGEMGLTGVISISPSLVSDAFLRQTFGFPLSNDLATLLVGFDLLAP
ncbi:MAG: hypothetical protein ABSG17_02515 [Spirochaetia bacterium]|jgi:hypothetical protein